jgi:hypothetical protein
MRMVAMLGLIGVAVTGTPALVSAADAKLYELTENMKLVQRHHKNQPAVGRRIATSAISGTAEPGTPLCPIPAFQGGQARCAINVFGQDNISLATGLGTIEGSFTTVIQGDNPVDGPEAVVLKGEFRGQMDFSPAILKGVPFGTVTGKVKADHNRKREDFTGVFRLPFDGNAEMEVEVAPGVKMKFTLRQILCPATPKANPSLEMYRGLDLAYLDNVEAVMTPAGRCLDIEPDELSLGAPLVRFDVDF